MFITGTPYACITTDHICQHFINVFIPYHSEKEHQH
jgi:hypothetical protein